MHEWHTNQSRNILSLIDEFKDFWFDTDYAGREKVSDVRVTNRMFTDHDKIISFVTGQSYGTSTAYLAAYTSRKILKGYQNAFDSFLTKYKEYTNFKNNLTIAYGRNASKVTCPDCGSSISLKYGNRFKLCPVCGSRKIISESNWKMLETKRKACEKAANSLEKEAEKSDVTFVCGIEWHC